MNQRPQKPSKPSRACNATSKRKGKGKPLARWSDDGESLIIGEGVAEVRTPKANAAKMRRYHEGAAARLAGANGARHRAIADAIAALGVKPERRTPRNAMEQAEAWEAAEQTEGA